MEIHDTLLTAVHEQPAVAVTAMFMPFPPCRAIDWLVGAMEYVHGGGGADCVTVNVCPATVNVPVRCAPVLAAIVNPTFPLPLPEAPDPIVSHGALLVAAHAHPVAAVTAIDVPAPTGRAGRLRRRIDRIRTRERLRHRECLPGNRQRAGALRAGVGGSGVSDGAATRAASRQL